MTFTVDQLQTLRSPFKPPWSRSPRRLRVRTDERLSAWPSLPEAPAKKSWCRASVEAKRPARLFVGLYIMKWLQSAAGPLHEPLRRSCQGFQFSDASECMAHSCLQMNETST